ncbi:MAG: hypothetical protein ACI9D5_002955, partial [Candidatus Endobugula sp.]
MRSIKTNGFLLLVITLGFLSGCTTNYLYTSKGNFQYLSGEQRSAVLYWRGDEGRTWYLSTYKEPDSDALLSVCNSASSANFVPTDESDAHHLITKSRAMDRKVATLAADGDVLLLSEPILLKDGSECGRILLGNEPANINALKEGEPLNIVFWCQNDTRTDRYPVPGAYKF